MQRSFLVLGRSPTITSSLHCWRLVRPHRSLGTHAATDAATTETESATSTTSTTTAPAPPIPLETVTIHALDKESFFGLARVSHKTKTKTHPVPGALPDEQVQCSPPHRRTKMMRLEKVLKSAPEREPNIHCKHFLTCGGCSIMHMTYAAQVQLKHNSVINIFRQHGLLAASTPTVGDVPPPEHGAELPQYLNSRGNVVRVLPPRGSPLQFGYRHKARTSVRYVEKKGGALVGFREMFSSKVANLESCPVLHPKLGNLLKPLGSLINQLSAPEQVPAIELIQGTDDSGTAVTLRHLSPLIEQDLDLMRRFATEHQVTLYTQSEGLDSIKRLDSSNSNELYYSLPDFNIKISIKPGGFMQANVTGNRVLVDAAIEHLELMPSKQDVVLDLFCGAGNFSLPIATRAAAVIGIDVSDEAMAAAKTNQLLNDVQNVRFTKHDLFELSPRTRSFLRNLPPGINKLLVDPPRSGCEQALRMCLQSLQHTLERIVYVSCNAVTQASDVAAITAEFPSFELSALLLFDNFPNTSHTESIVVLTKRPPSSDPATDTSTNSME